MRTRQTRRRKRRKECEARESAAGRAAAASASISRAERPDKHTTTQVDKNKMDQDRECDKNNDDGNEKIMMIPKKNNGETNKY